LIITIGFLLSFFHDLLILIPESYLACQLKWNLPKMYRRDLMNKLKNLLSDGMNIGKKQHVCQGERKEYENGRDFDLTGGSKVS
jgi:hypothetical protein